MKKYCLLTCFFILAISVCKANPGDTSFVRKQYHTKRMAGAPVVLDGIPNEEIWNSVEWGGDFTQWQPNEGKAPSQPTQFKILYDNKFLYVAYNCIDRAPDSIDKRMGRRDDFPGDFVEIKYRQLP
jgi:hypothetical protein